MDADMESLTEEQKQDFAVFQELLRVLLEDNSRTLGRAMNILSNLVATVISFDPRAESIAEKFSADVKSRVKNYKKLNKEEAEEAIITSVLEAEA